MRTKRFFSRAVAVFFLLVVAGFAAYAAGEDSTGYRIARRLEEMNLPPWLVVLFISTLPIVELRGAVPVACLLFKMPVWEVYVLSVVGNMIPIVPILLLMEPASRLLQRFEAGRRFLDWLFARTRRKTEGLDRYKFFGLTVFVAIPLPVTGAWTGSLAAFLLGIPFWRALASIFLGVMIAGVVVTAVSVGISLFGWPLAVLVAAIAAAAWMFTRGGSTEQSAPPK